MKPKKPPKAQPPAPMPDEEEIRRKQRKDKLEMVQRSGRQSTIMSDVGQSETLG